MTQLDIAKKFAVGTPAHRKLEEAIASRLRLSQQKMSNRYEQMARNEETFQAYIPTKEIDRLRKNARLQNGTMDYTTVEIPHAYAVLMTAHTYFTSVFLSRDPVLQLSGRHGEGETNRVAIESLLNYQMVTGENILPLFIWLLDPGKYGFGVIGHSWYKDTVLTRKWVEKPVTFFGMPVPGKKQTVEELEETVGFEGNKLYNIRPQDFLPDPRVALVHFQKGEFCARYVEVPWHEIYEGRCSPENPSGRYFNYSSLLRMRTDRTAGQQGGTPTRDIGSSAVTTLPVQDEVEGFDIPVGFVKSHEFAIRLCPKDWGIGPSSRQEVWMFNRSTNGVVFGAQPLGEFTNKFPYDILVDEIDGYSVFPRSQIERVKPLNDVISWLINSHMYNVRATMNNQFVVDPSMLVMKDVTNPNPGKIIRLRPEMYGRDVRTAISQLVTSDVTRNHIGDVQTFLQFIERLTGVNDSVMGMLQGGDRKTATEVRTSTSFGVNRLKTQCEWFSTVGFGPLTMRLTQRTQQYYDTPRKYKLVGDTALLAPNFGIITPEQIAGFWDYVPVDGTLPVDRFAQATLWNQLIGQMAAAPQILAKYDIARIFAWVAQLAGVKNMAQFELQPMQQIQQSVQAGNSVPISTAQAEFSTQLPNAGPVR